MKDFKTKQIKNKVPPVTTVYIDGKLVSRKGFIAEVINNLEPKTNYTFMCSFTG